MLQMGHDCGDTVSLLIMQEAPGLAIFQPGNSPGWQERTGEVPFSAGACP